MKNLCLILFLPLLVFLFSTNVTASDFPAKVIHIADGDTITVLNDTNEQIKIRLNGIDCPEKAQAYGTDRYGRTIADVILEDGRNLSQELVKVGLAWWYYRYSDNRELGQLELDAKLAHVGLWKDKNAVPPWVFRKVKDLLH